MSVIIFVCCAFLCNITIFLCPVSSSNCSSPWSTWTTCLYHGYRSRFRDSEGSSAFSSCSRYPDVQSEECRDTISTLNEDCCILAGTSASWPEGHVMTSYIILTMNNSDGDKVRLVMGVEEEISMPTPDKNIMLLVIPKQSEGDGDVIQLLPPHILIADATSEPQLCLTDSISKGEVDVMVLEPMAKVETYKIIHSKDHNCSSEWSSWSQCIDGIRSRSRDCYKREFNCSFFPEIITEPCQQLGLLFPPDNTLFLVPGEVSTVKLRPIMVGLPVSFAYSSPDSNSPVLTSNGAFQWTFPLYERDGDYSFEITLENTEGHHRLVDLIVKSPHCSCVGMENCVLAPWGTVGIGPFQCECPVGWTGEQCDTDINECTEDLNPCFDGVSCINVIGSFWCDGCPEGMLGDGLTCSS